MPTTAVHSLFLPVAIPEDQRHSVLWFLRQRQVHQHRALVPGMGIVKERPVRPTVIVAIPIRVSTVYAREMLE